MTTHIMPTYGRLAVTFDHGEGAWLWDTEGNRYLDALAGISVCNLGHAHPAISRALCEQSRKLIHTSNLYQVALQEQLADQLALLSGMDNVFFCNSGTEANEAAIKIARQYAHQRGINDPAILTTHRSFHGRTLGALSATGNEKVKKGFGPLLPGFVHVTYNDIAAIEQAIAEQPSLVAILVEPIQGEGGVNIPAPDYLNRIRDLCDRHDLLMMLDEIQTGIGRTGRFLAYQHNGILPDVCTLAKALGNGVPIGACLARGKAAQVMSAGSHGSTFGGNPLACSAALAVIETLTGDRLIETANDKGQRIVQGFKDRIGHLPGVVSIHNLGMMIGIELAAPCTELVGKALSRQLLINVTAESKIRLLPPLIFNDEQIDLLVDTLSTLLTEHLDTH